MYDNLIIKPIAVIHTPFKEKFGIPRQSGMSEAYKGEVEFLPPYDDPEAVRELERFTHIWLIFDFTLSHTKEWSPTVRPPRLGGNKRVGVFASRSPFRPNPLGLSSVRLDSVERNGKGKTVLKVSGTDILDGTPIYDIKPYIPYSDCHPDAGGGYSVSEKEYRLTVTGKEIIESAVKDEGDMQAIYDCISNDPRPSYQNDPEREYKMRYGKYEIGFRVNGMTAQVNSAVIRDD